MRLERSSTGIFGGTFNPIHVGHLRAAEEVCDALGLARMIFVPSADPPLKREGEMRMAPAEARLTWVRMAVQGNPRFQVDPLEMGRPGPSYSVDTLRILGERLAPERPVFVIGDDAFADLASWKDPGTLVTLAHFAVIDRSRSGSFGFAERLDPVLAKDFEIAPDGREARHGRAGTWLRWLPLPVLDVSSTDIRRRLGEGRSVRYLLPEEVRRAIESSGTYTARPER
jgi:nicotinate-nucleotide adenylyltransferase